LSSSSFRAKTDRQLLPDPGLHSPLHEFSIAFLFLRDFKQQVRYNHIPMSYKILLIDDEVTLSNTVRTYLEKEGYTVHTAVNGRMGLHLFHQVQPHLVILDIMLPELDGLEVLRQLRQSSNIYVIMLTAKADETDKIVGLSMGADDYMTKPFSPRELVARVKAALRRMSSDSENKAILVSQRFRVDIEARLAWKDEQPLDLTPIEFALLRTFIHHRGRALSREQLIEQVWGHDYYSDDRVVDVHVGRLRKKVEDDPTQPAFIVTAWGTGYRFEDEMA
jgi:two-component system alkaline phosphatase synthesis response regulator PhoP